LETLEDQVQKRTQHLKRREQQLRSSVEQIPVSLAIVDREMRYLLVSDCWKINHHLNDQEIIGRSHYEVFPTTSDRWQQIYQRCLAGASDREEDSFISADGLINWVQWEIRPWYTETEDIGGLILVDQVTTDRKAAEISSSESEEQLRQIVDNISDVFFLRCMNTQQLLYTNLAYEQIFQRSREIAYHQSEDWIEAIHPEDRDRILVKFQRELEGNEFFNDEYRIVLPDGSIRWILDRSFPIYNQSGSIYRYAGVTRDITERKLVKLALQQSEFRFQTLVKNMPGMVYLYFPADDGIGFFTYVSSGSIELLELEPDRILQDANSVWSLIHPDDFPFLRSSVAVAVQNCAAWSWEGRLTTPSGQLKWIQGRSRPEQTPDGMV
jgi:PAS domain S-box-containing protein